MIRLALAPGLLALVLAGAAQSQSTTDLATSGDPAAFVVKAAQSDEFERQEGNLAADRARHSEVRMFAAMMVHDHTQTTEGLEAAMRRAGMPPPPPPTLSPDQASMLAALDADHGPDFDMTYLRQQVIAHKAALDLMEAYAASGPPGPIRDAAAHTAPLVRRHLDDALGLETQIGG